ncbi:MAG: hypothetical protein SVY15_00775 [Halobacteriota archaeon]|nr:hypothetical protein [Halobacteriota archaeon]
MPSSKKKTKVATVAQKRRVIKKVYELGVDVGYHKHYEMGWVLERYDKIYNVASEYGFEDKVKEFYERGKEDGVKKKLMSISSGLVEKSVGESYDENVKREKQKRVEEEVTPKSTTTQRRFTFETKTVQSPTSKPEMISSPKMTEKTTATDLPAFLEAFRLLRND